MAFNFFSQPVWVLADCITGRIHTVEQFPYVLGAGPGADHTLAPHSELLPLHCALAQDKNRDLRLILKNPAAVMALDGSHRTFAELQVRRDYALQIPGHYFIIRGGDKSEMMAWSSQFNHKEWMLYDNSDGSSSLPLPLPALLSWAYAEGKQPMACALFPNGSQSGFHLVQFPEDMAETSFRPASREPKYTPNPVVKIVASSPPTPPSPPPYSHPAIVIQPAMSVPSPLIIQPVLSSQQPPVVQPAPYSQTPPVVQPAPASKPSHPPALSTAVIDAGDEGEYFCPTCWLCFDAEDVMHVAVHDSLRGDPLLGEDAPQRFHATTFNNRGQAMDAMGIPCFDTACPHCRAKFPPSFINSPHHIFSVVGNASAGKTYFLAVLAKIVPSVAYRHLGIIWQDADPGANASLNDMRDRLFGAESPENAALDKTQTGNATTYQDIPRHGKLVQMPKPFSFHVSSRANEDEHATVIFYDNAGEHFRPDVRIESSPGALHVASASALFFLFDPINNTEFRQRLRGQPDPQLQDAITSDMQDVILSEIRSRMMRLGHLTLRAKSSKPLAVMVGKSDAWMHLLGPGVVLRPAIVSGKLHLPNLYYNSDVTRELLLDSSPAIAANAEALSSNVMFFPISTFGHTPLRVQKASGVATIAPDPQLLRPQLVEAPILWALHQLIPNLVPVADGLEMAK